MRSRIGQLRALIALGLLLAVAGPARAGTDEWFLAEQKEKHIRNWIKDLYESGRELSEKHAAGAVYLLDEEHYFLQDHSVDVYVNQILQINDQSAEHLSDYVYSLGTDDDFQKAAAFYLRPGSTRLADAEDAEIHQVDRTKVRLLEPDDGDALAEVMFNFPTLRPGDIIGISILKRLHFRLGSATKLVARSYPVVRAQMRIKTTRNLGYRYFGEGFEKGQFQRSVLEEKKGHIREIFLIAQRVEPLKSELFSPPRWIQSPRFFVIQNRRRIRDRHTKNFDWLKTGNWALMAVAVDWRYQQLSRDDDGFTAHAKLLLGDARPSNMTVESAFAFVRDEFQNIGRRAVSNDNEYPSFDQLLESRAADQSQKAYMLRELLLLAGFKDIDIVWVHDPRDGKFYPVFPSLNEVDLPVVRLRHDGEESWLDPACRTCPAGDLRSFLRGAPAMRFEVGIAKTVDDGEYYYKAWDESNGTVEHTWEIYLTKLQNKRWAEAMTTPGGGHRLVGSTTERVEYEQTDSGSGNRAQIEVLSVGSTAARRYFARSDELADLSAKWVEDRYAGFSDLTLRRDPIVGALDSLRVSATAKTPPLPAPTGENWILPSSVVFGDPILQSWPERRETDVWIEDTQEWIRETILPLPEGWTDAQLPPAQQLSSDVLTYSLTAMVEGSAIVVRRRFHQIRAHQTDESVIRKTAECAVAVHNVETSPFIIRRVVSP